MPRVLIIGGGTLLDEAMIGLLQTETDFHVTSVANGTEDELIECIERWQPEVILISETDDLPGCQIVNAIYRQVLAPKLRIILVELDSNTIRVCDFVTASQSEDLLRLIRSGGISGAASMD